MPIAMHPLALTWAKSEPYLSHMFRNFRYLTTKLLTRQERAVQNKLARLSRQKTLTKIVSQNALNG